MEEIKVFKKYIEEKEFKKEFGIELRTKPINGIIIAEELFGDDFQEKIERYQKRVKEIMKIVMLFYKFNKSK